MMNKNDRYRMAKDVSQLRRLQLECAQLDVSVERIVVDRATSAEKMATREAEDRVASLQALLRDKTTLDPAMIQNWMAAAATAQQFALDAKAIAESATARLDVLRNNLSLKQHQFDSAANNARQAKAQVRKKSEEQHYNLMEDMLLARELPR